ncbi:Uncharacterised protein [Klebsiella pneumoniae]|nr:Uncharacterised protein [Klebsiella pneumoniae]
MLTQRLDRSCHFFHCGTLSLLHRALDGFDKGSHMLCLRLFSCLTIGEHFFQLASHTLSGPLTFGANFSHRCLKTSEHVIHTSLHSLLARLHL